MNVRKNIDYSELFAAIDCTVSASLPRMKLYREIGRLINARPEKGAAVTVAQCKCQVKIQSKDHRIFSHLSL